MIQENTILSDDMKQWPENLSVGTCSWKYDSWQGLIYTSEDKNNYLSAYARHFNSVEIDQWFWSLYGPEKVRLPDPDTVLTYVSSVPESFSFTVKAPNSLTLTHLYRKSQQNVLQENPHFLSESLFHRFLRQIEPMLPQTAVIMLQFEYLNKKKMESLEAFIKRLDRFVTSAGCPVPLGVEIRNPNFLRPQLFQFLKEKNIIPVFLEGYYMPPVTPVLNQHGPLFDSLVIRLIGPDRQGIEKKTGKQWNRVAISRDDDLVSIIQAVTRLLDRGCRVGLNINNHYEGSAPLTIEKIHTLLQTID